jgi:hypothetical protein
MKILLGFLLLGAVSAHAAEISPFDPKWKECQLDSDCKLMKGPCGPESGNKRYKKEIEAYYLEQSLYIECMPPRSRKVKPVCDENRCGTQAVR